MGKKDSKDKKKPVKKEPRFTALNSRDMKPILKFIVDHYGYTKEFDYAMIQTAKNKIYIVSKEVFTLPVETLRVNSYGMYFGEWKRDELRLSIEGSQLIGPSATKNVLDLTVEQRNAWMTGEDLPLADNLVGAGYVILRCEGDYLGCGWLNDEKLFNFVPKNRRIRFKIES